MKFEGEGQLLRVFVSESDTWEGRPLADALVELARERGLAGATLVHGAKGFGAHTRIHPVEVLRLSDDRPVIVEIVDRPESIAQLLPEIELMVLEGLVTVENVHVVSYRHKRRV